MQTQTRTPALRIQSLSKTYRGQKGTADFEAVQDITLEVQQGEVLGLLGPNGAGKSTTIQCVAGFYPPTKGAVFINGIDVHQQPKAARVYLGLCSQEDNLDTDFTVYDQLVWHARYFHIPSKDAAQRAHALLDRFDLLSKRDARIEALSGGMKRRLQVARALIGSPKLLVLDEPTTGLDPEVRRVLWDVLMEAKSQGMAILLCTHYMEEAARLCDKVAILHKGKILDMAPPEVLVKKYISEEIIDEEVRPGVVWHRPPHLEDVYLKLTGKNLGGMNL